MCSSSPFVGFSSFPETPGTVYRCFGTPSRCPGGPPGTCASGRDTARLSCSRCLPGLHDVGGVCAPCSGEDYALLTFSGLLVILGITFVYWIYSADGKSRQNSLLIVGLALGLLVNTVQYFSVVNQMQINWDEPLRSWISLAEIVSFDLDYISIGCVVPSKSLVRFAMQTFLVFAFFMVAIVVHVAFQVGKRLRQQRFQWELGNLVRSAERVVTVVSLHLLV